MKGSGESWMQIHEKKFIRIDTLTRGYFFFFLSNETWLSYFSPSFLFLRVFATTTSIAENFTSNLSSSPLLTNFPRFARRTTVGNYRSRRFTLAAVSLTSIRVHGRQCFRNTRRRVPLPPMRASSLLVSSIYRSPSWPRPLLVWFGRVPRTPRVP